MKIKKLSTVAVATMIAATATSYTGMTLSYSSQTSYAIESDTQADFILRGSDVIYKSGEINYMDFYTESNGHKGAMIVCEVADLPAGITAKVDETSCSAFEHEPLWSLMGETWCCQTMDPTTKDPLAFNDENYIISLLVEVDNSLMDGVYEIGFSRFHVVEQPNEFIGPIVEFDATVIPGKLIVGDAVDTPAFVKGDVNSDGAVDSSDASLVLSEYASVQTGNASSFTESQKLAADVNDDGDVSATDASAILAYYADAATGKNPSWN